MNSAHGRFGRSVFARGRVIIPRIAVSTLGQYQLIRKIGHGGMAEVWSARRDNPVGGQKYVAIKILARHLAENERYREMFVGEARISLTLNHANIVSVFEVVENEGECYMVMELIEGMTLSQLCRALAKRGEGLPTQVSIYIVAELLRALAYAHTLQTDHGSTIVHRDVSPQNIMVSTSGEVKLMDFGIARFSTEETSGNLVKGKLQYMPPEQLSKRTREPTVDLFAVGGILQELLEGKRFRSGVEQEVLLGMVFRGEVPEPTVDIPPALEEVRFQLLQPDPDVRLSSAKEALSMLYDWPDYRNASMELEEIVCQFVEPSSATSLPDGAVPHDVSSDLSGRFLAGAGAGAGAIAASVASSTPPPPAEAADADAGAEPAADAELAASDDALVESVGALADDDPFMTYEDRDFAEDADEDELDSDLRLDGPAPDSTNGDALEAMTTVEVHKIPAHELDDEPLGELPGSAQGRRVALIIGGVLLAVLLLVVWRSGVLGGEPEPEAASEVEPETKIVAAPPVEPDPEEASADAAPEGGTDPGGETGGTQDAGLDDGPDAEATDDDDDEDEVVGSKPTKKKPEVATKVSVEFVASQFYFVYVKVAGRVLTLEPKTSTRLPVGTHSVYLREKPTGDWKRAGSITLKRGANYRVEMKKPAGLRLIKK